jgi:Flp pilus assembly protein TadG
MVEFGLWLPIVLLALAGCVQLSAALYDARAAQDAARAALRAQQSGADPYGAARATLDGRGGAATITTGDGTVRVVLPVRRVLPWLPDSIRTVTGSAEARS